MSRRIRLFLFIAIGLAAVIGLVVLGLYLAARHEPAFYREALEIEPAVLEKASDDMLRRTAALASAVKKEGHWEALFTAEQINGWLAVDLVKNHPSALPPTLHDPRVTIDQKRITIACRFEQGGVNSVLSLTVEPSMPEPNVIALRIVKARAGLLPVPLAKVLDRVSQAARGMECRLQWRNTGGDPVAMLSFPDADDDRPVSIESLRLGDGEIYVAGTTQGQKP
jgi:hypothetical protein